MPSFNSSTTLVNSQPPISWSCEQVYIRFAPLVSLLYSAPNSIAKYNDTYIKLLFKAGFHMIADDRRRSRIVDRRSPTIAEPTVAYISVSGSVRKIAANNMADVEEETLLQANLFLLLVLKRRHRQRQNRRFWVRRIFLKRQELGAFHTLVRELRVFVLRVCRALTNSNHVSLLEGIRNV